MFNSSFKLLPTSNFKMTKDLKLKGRQPVAVRYSLDTSQNKI